jgi:hypothetical protein
LEEAAHMNKDIFLKIFVPLMGVDNFAVLAISTADDEFNYYTELIELEREPGKRFFFSIVIQLACRACRLAHRMAQCQHRKYLLPPWKTSKRQDLMQTIMASDPELYARENLGVVISTRTFLFTERVLKRFRQRPQYALRRKPQIVYIGIDPSGGGSGSDYTIMSSVFEQGHHVVRCVFFLFVSVTSAKSPSAQPVRSGATRP